MRINCRKTLTNAKSVIRYILLMRYADASVAHLVERHLAKVEVASSSLVTRSKQENQSLDWFFSLPFCGKKGINKKFIRE